MWLPCCVSRLRTLDMLTRGQVEYFKKQRVVNYQKEMTIKRIEAEGGEIIAPQLPVGK